MDDPIRERYVNIEESVQDADFMASLQLANPRHHALLRNTCSITRLGASDKINVVPPEATLELDCRVLPDQDVEAFIAEITTIVNDPQIRVEKLMAFTPAVSSADTDLYRAIIDVVDAHHPGALIVPSVSTGFTDSHFFRDLGIASYGFSPVVTPPTDVRGVHGNNERARSDNLVNGTQAMVDLLFDFTGI
jgi:acetylornithine deacetylase/succinyl-diaminopimelate desuccinylase-like protein